MKNIRIDKPCTEDWSKMTPTQKGAFCQKCAMEVYDFTNKSSEEIKQVLRDQLGQRVCGRFTTGQQASMNDEFEAWKFDSKRSMQRAMLFSLIVVFGLTLFSCSNQADEERILKIQEVATQTIDEDDSKQRLEPLELNKPEDVNEDVVVEAVEVMTLGEVGYTVLPDVNVVDYTTMDVIHDQYVLGGAVMMTHEYVDYLMEPYVLIDSLKIPELDENGLAFPTEFSTKVYPNPATIRTTLEFKAPKDIEVAEISLYDMNGRFIQSIHSGKVRRGTHTYALDLMGLEPGMYLAVLASDEFKETVRISKSQ